ncbi:MAG: MurT ligase domain-containing protein [Firmicutes bacterium]|nr:MurT ligase domain-containing protein [Bacillota bacterium]
MLRFYITLWISKFAMWVYKLRGQERNDRPGLLAFKLCPDFLKYIKKPPIVITITGTNGKSTTSALINNKLVEEGYKVSFNDWGANLYAGFALNLMRCVNIFNKSTYDVSVLEADERTLDISMGQIEPNYILVTNICKDSLRRNGHPEFIFDIVDRTFDILGDKTTAILNANDPISSQLAKKSKRVFYGMTDINANPFENGVKDIAVCPNCGELIRYNYRLYRHLGDFYCPNCDFKTPEIKYYAKSVDLEGRKMTVEENGEDFEYPLISDAVFNSFNVLSCIAVLRELCKSKEEIAKFLETQQVTKIRETCVEYNGIKYYTYGAKSQNISAASTVFEYMAKEPSDKNVVLLLDELQDKNHPTETLTWLYETDYEFLNSPNIKKIIVGGHMFLNHKLRLLLAGIPEEKIICVESESEIPNYVDTEGIEKVYVLFEIDCVTKARNMRDAIVEKAKEGAR